jgi:hypothetical protein
MTQKNFKVKNGLTIGDDAIVADEATGSITTVGTIKNAGKGIYAGSNRTFTGGDTTDVTRLKGTTGTDTYNAYTGLLASNADKTTTLGARPAVVIRGYGQNISGGLTTTAANPLLSFETTRGTPATPVSIGASEALGAINFQGNAGTTSGTAYWTTDNYSAPPGQIVMATTQAYSATASASATFTANFTTGTTMTVTAVSSGTISPLHEVRYSSGGSGAFTVNNTFAIHTQLTSDQAAAATTTATGTRLSNTMVVASATGIVVGQLVTGTGIPSGTYVGSIASTTITLVNSVSAPAQLSASISASTVNFYTPGGTGTYQLNLSPYTATTTGVVCTTTATTLGNVFIVRNQPSSHALTTASRAQTQLVSASQHLYVAQSPYNTSHFLWQTWPTTMPGGTAKTLMALGPQNSSILADRFTLNSFLNPANQYTLTTPAAASDGNLSVSLQMNTDSANKFPLFNLANRRTTDNTNYTPTLNNDNLGGFKFNGNANTGTTPGVPAGPAAQIGCVATEDWTSIANGAKISFTVIKKGATTDCEIISGASDQTVLRSDAFSFRNSSDIAVTSAAVNYTRTYGEFCYTGANITATVTNTIYAFPLNTTNAASGTSISNTSRINIGVSGWYKIIMSLQTNMQTNSLGSVDFWLRKNGVDVANSNTQVDLLKDQKAVIAMDWLVNSNGNDYWEIVYAVNDTNLIFPWYAASSSPYVKPATPPIIVNVIPMGM